MRNPSNKPHLEPTGKTDQPWSICLGHLGYAVLRIHPFPDERGTWDEVLNWPGWEAARAYLARTNGGQNAG